MPCWLSSCVLVGWLDGYVSRGWTKKLGVGWVVVGPLSFTLSLSLRSPPTIPPSSSPDQPHQPPQVSWEDGLRMTVDWYKKHTGRYGNIESALVAHPRAGGVTGAAPDIVL